MLFRANIGGVEGVIDDSARVAAVSSMVVGVLVPGPLPLLPPLLGVNTDVGVPIPMARRIFILRLMFGRMFKPLEDGLLAVGASIPAEPPDHLAALTSSVRIRWPWRAMLEMGL
jgi:hypothetical protein